MFSRRTLLARAAALGSGLSLGGLCPAWARSGSAGVLAGAPGVLTGEDIALTVGRTSFRVGGVTSPAVTVNGSLPGPLLRLCEGQPLRIAVTNTLAEDTAIHWHGMLLPFQMDGVPGISFPGIRPGATFHYSFPVRQAGTYWYHSHANMQEALGLYGAIIIDPATPDPVAHDREHVILLSDWSTAHPHSLLRRLKAEAGYFNHQKQTLIGAQRGRRLPLRERLMWARMRMDPTDISDVTGAAYAYLVNGHTTTDNWTGLFRPGERVRLRIINAAAMTNFNVRIDGLPMTVVQADGQNVQPVTTGELQIGIAETYDVLVTPPEGRAYGLIAEAIDRSGLCRATLAPQQGMVAPLPPRRPRPTLSMKDMGMETMGMAHHGAMDHAAMAHEAPPMAAVLRGPGVASVSAAPVDRTGDRPTGLEDVPHPVLTYADLRALQPSADTAAPARTLDVHLTANMERYMWSFDGVAFSEGPTPLAFAHNERVRIRLINDTMMPHPIHLHGHFFEVVTGHPGAHPRKHTVNVLPGGIVTIDLTADAPGDWAFHCHMLLHMHAGMFRIVSVGAPAAAA